MNAAAIKALAKAQSEMGKAIRNAINPHLRTRYADLASVMEAALPALNANGFALLQPCGRDEIGPYVDTILAHESGDQFVSRVHLVMGKADMQGYGSAVTYARRYGLMGLAGIAPEDDDGEGQKVPPRPQVAAPTQRPAPSTDVQEAIAFIEAQTALPILADYWRGLVATDPATAADPRVIAAKDAQKATLMDAAARAAAAYAATVNQEDDE